MNAIATRDHALADGTAVACHRAAHGRCRVCELVDRDGPHYREEYRRLFYPGEFPDVADVQVPASHPASQATSHPTSTSIPLAGDLVEGLAKRLGADRAARWVAGKLGVDCGCAERRDALNRIDRLARRFLGWDPPA